jgi:hypothetical protein
MVSVPGQIGSLSSAFDLQYGLDGPTLRTRTADRRENSEIMFKAC